MSLFLVIFLVKMTGYAQVPQLGTNTIAEVVAAMTTAEKIDFLVGTGMTIPSQNPSDAKVVDKVAGMAGSTYAIPRLNIPSMVVADGPAGLRIQPTRPDAPNQTFYCTAFPVATLLAASWDANLVQQAGAAMGNEVKEYGVDILLGPGMNIHRNPLGGRNFEYYSEDPLLSGTMAAAMVRGIQSNGVGTSIKHFVANNQETNRNSINTKISQRALREIYLKGFEIAVKTAEPWTVMSAYNRLNGGYTSESKDLLTNVLLNDWKYNGFVMTDWFGGSDAVAQMKAGNALLMPGVPPQKKQLTEAIANKTLDEAVLDQNAALMLGIILKSPSFKKYAYSNKPDLQKNAAIARAIAAEGMVLLKNDKNTLPLKPSSTVAVLGKTSVEFISGGTGSGDVNEAYTISLQQGLQNAGFKSDAKLKTMYEEYTKTERAKQGPRPQFWFLPIAPIAEKVLTADELNIATQAQTAVITIGRTSGEFMDRKQQTDYEISSQELELIKSVAEAFHKKGKKVVVILNIGAPTEVASWSSYADAILLAWQPGQEAGNAIADILVGKINPSGKLPTTFALKYEDEPTAKSFPGVELPEPERKIDPNDPMSLFIGKKSEVIYNEGVFMGYRYFNSFGIKTAYPFGYGMSYTSFGYSNLKLSKATFAGKMEVSVTITNTGKTAGKEVVQLYITAPSATMPKPESELRAFAKTKLLKAGEAQTLKFTINPKDLCSFDTQRSAWVAEPGSYTIKVAASSQDVRQKAAFALPKELVVETVSNSLAPEQEIVELKK